MASQREILDLQAFEIEIANDAGIGSKAAHKLASRQVGGPLNLSYTLRDHKNYLRIKRQREIAYGQAGSMLKYFHDKIAENPSFQYALQMDREKQITNIEARAFFLPLCFVLPEREPHRIYGPTQDLDGFCDYLLRVVRWPSDVVGTARQLWTSLLLREEYVRGSRSAR